MDELDSNLKRFFGSGQSRGLFIFGNFMHSNLKWWLKRIRSDFSLSFSQSSGAKNTHFCLRSLRLRRKQSLTFSAVALMAGSAAPLSCIRMPRWRGLNFRVGIMQQVAVNNVKPTEKRELSFFLTTQTISLLQSVSQRKINRISKTKWRQQGCQQGFIRNKIKYFQDKNFEIIGPISMWLFRTFNS